MTTTEKLNALRGRIHADIHTLRCKIGEVRYGIVAKNPEMIVDAVNQMDATIRLLERQTPLPEKRMK
jgi:hypothetical protein